MKQWKFTLKVKFNRQNVSSFALMRTKVDFYKIKMVDEYTYLISFDVKGKDNVNNIVFALRKNLSKIGIKDVTMHGIP